MLREKQLIASKRDGEGGRFHYSEGSQAPEFSAFFRWAADFSGRDLDAVHRAIVAGLPAYRLLRAARPGGICRPDSDISAVADRGVCGRSSEPVSPGDCDPGVF